MRPSRRLTYTMLIVPAFLVALSSLAINSDRAYVKASTDSREACATEDSRNDVLQGEPAVDYLKQHGLFDRIKASVEASRYEINRQATGGYRANNPAQNLQAWFTRDGAQIAASQVSKQQSWPIGMKLRGIGYGDGISEVTSGPLRTTGSRIEILHSAVGTPHSALVEWYVNKPEGIEQGFTLTERPGVKFGTEPLRVALTLTGGLKASLEDEGQAVILARRDGKQVLRYDHLAASDALGRNLPARMELREGEVLLLVDDSSAVYPVMIDPLFTEVKKLTASDGAANERFGYAVGINNSTLVVGAYNDDSRGSAYIYERNKGGADSWGEVKKLTASDGAANDQFGVSLGISGDTVVVGAPRNDSGKGAAYVFERNKGGADNWGQVKKLTASDGTSGDQFGYSVGISGDTVVVGAPHDDSSSGSAYVFERNKGGADSWGEVKKLTASDRAASDGFGIGVGVSGGTVVVGASGDSSGKGSAYIYERNRGGADNWGEVKKLIASDGVASDQFGYSVAIGGDTIGVGAFGDDSEKGSAYVFERNKTGAENWGEVRKLTASDGAAGDRFGSSAGISGDTIVVGARGDDSNKGSAYVFERNKAGAENWGEVKKLTASDGVPGDEFGISVGINGGTVVVGAFGDDSGKGSAYTFISQADQWVQQRKPTASDGTANDQFGISVGISDDTVVVGANLDDSSKGSAYIYERNKGGADNWGEVKRLAASDGTGGDQFGQAVGISGATVVVGAHLDDSSQGSAYVFERNKGGADNWGEVRKLTASDGAANDRFGFSVGITGATVVIGAYLDDSFKGSAYVFERNKGGVDNWGQVRKLTASDGAGVDLFGYSVGISGDMVVVGAWGDDSEKGSAYVFERNKGGVDNWGEVKKVTASDGAATDQFGFSVGISGDVVVVGARGDDSNRGSAYVFERNRGGADNWGQVRKLMASDSAGLFGQSVGISADTVVVGPFTSNLSKGSIYVFERNKGGADLWGEVKRVTASDGAANDRFGLSLGISGDTIFVGAYLDDSGKGSAYVFTVFPEAVNVSAANFQRTALAPEMIAAAFGIDLATGTETAATIPLPTNLHGTTISVKDSAGSERSAQLFFVSPGQVNYYIPAGTSLGPATVKITTGSGQISFGTVEIATTSPGFFSANSTGQGIAAALALRVRGAQQSYEEISRFDAGTNSFVAIPVDLGPPGDQVFLVMFGTGFRFRSSESGVGVKVGGRTLQSLFTGAAGSFLGLDQMNISPLPRELAGAGVVNIEITVDGKSANTTTVSIK